MAVVQHTSREPLPGETTSLDDVERLTRVAESRWAVKIQVDKLLTRSLVSFQANKGRSVYRWFKYKEAFSADLIEYLFRRYQISGGKVLDPFAGSGTALFVASGHGISAEGIELLPIGRAIIEARRIVEEGLNEDEIGRLTFWIENRPWRQGESERPLSELRITKGAYPPATAKAIGAFLHASEKEDEKVKTILRFSLFCILESVSYTRKDGQYLRWDHRAGRRQGKKVFDKGVILPFDKAMTQKLRDVVSDIRSTGLPEDLFGSSRQNADVRLHEGSCLEVLPRVKTETYDCSITSPPYCNRYDYTRTYALELALLGVDEEGLKTLRQEMLSCTVENRAKDLLAMNPAWRKAVRAADEQALLQCVLGYLDSQKDSGLLNNNGIPRMVRGYFYEMACVIAECARVLKKGAPLFMVNDNVRYAGASIPVDIILSEIAEKLGFWTERILVLPNGKGNSSQQMGAHGREALRKCVYIWRKE